jgi:hypothetical protein
VVEGRRTQFKDQSGLSPLSRLEALALGDSVSALDPLQIARKFRSIVTALRNASLPSSSPHTL